jgi:hypothetical protein
MRTVKVLRMRVAGRPILVRFKRGMKNLADHWMAGRNNRNPRIPKGEVWVNARLLKDKERLKRVLAHEKVELELMLRKGYSYRQAHRIASGKEAVLARRVKVALLVLLAPLLLASLASADPGLGVYNLNSKPSWYDGTLQPNQVKYLSFSWTQLSGYSEFNWQPDDWSSPFTLYLGGYSYRYVGSNVLRGGVYIGTATSYSWTLTRVKNPWVPLAAYAYFYNANSDTVTVTITITFNYADGTTSSKSASGSVAYTYTLGTGWLLYNGMQTGKLLSSVTLSVSLSAASSGSYVSVYLDGPWYAQVTQSFALSGNSFSPFPSGGMFANWTARFNRYIVSVSPSPAGAYLDEATDPGPGPYTVTFPQWWANWTLPASTLTFHDTAMNSLGSATVNAGQYVLALDAVPTYLKLNSTVYYVPATGNGTSFTPPNAPVLTIGFTVEDYGAGYQALKAYTLEGKLAGSRLIASKQATMNLTYGGTYSLALWKPGEERAFGLYAATSTSAILYVLPAAKQFQPPGSVQAWYNQTDSNFYVVVNCSSPPCSVVLRKYYPNGTNVVLATWTCTQNYCRYTLLAADPLVTAEATDSNGTKLMSFAGTSLFGLLNQTQKQALQDIFNKVAQGWPQAWGGQAGLLAFGGVLIFLALTIPGYLLLGAIALGMYITLVGVVFNIWIVAGTGFTILIAIAVIEYIVKQS